MLEMDCCSNENQVSGKRKTIGTAPTTGSDALAGRVPKLTTESQHVEASRADGNRDETGLQALDFGTPEERRVTAFYNGLMHDPQSDLMNSAFLIKSGLTEARAARVMRRRTLPFKLYFQVNTRELFAFALNGNDVHEALVAEISAQLRACVVADGNRLIVTHGMRMNGTRRMNPDQCLGLNPRRVPASVSPAHRDRLVVQVGVSESVASLHSHAAHLFATNTAVQVYLYIKIWPKRRNLTRAACVAVYRRGQACPVQLMSIGDASPTDHFQQFYAVQSPGVLLPAIQNLDVVPASHNANLFAITIPGSWILPGVVPALADLVIDCSSLEDLVLGYS